MVIRVVQMSRPYRYFANFKRVIALNIVAFHIMLLLTYTYSTYTWCGSVYKAPVSLHHRYGFYEPSDEVADQGCCCFLERWQSWTFYAHQDWVLEICRAKLEFLIVNTYVSEIFRQRVVQASFKYGYCIFLMRFCTISVGWVLHIRVHSHQHACV